MTKLAYKEIERIVQHNENQWGAYIPLFTTGNIGGNSGYYLIEDSKVSPEEYNQVYNEIKIGLSLR